MKFQIKLMEKLREYLAVKVIEIENPYFTFKILDVLDYLISFSFTEYVFVS